MGTKNIYQPLGEAYSLIDEMVRTLPPCSCHESCTSRNLIDPGCTHCDAVEDDVYNGMVAWRNEMTRLYMTDEVMRKEQGLGEKYVR